MSEFLVEEDFECITKKLKVKGLYTIDELERTCTLENVTFTEETNMDLLSITLNKLGTSVSQKIVMKC